MKNEIVDSGGWYCRWGPPLGPAVATWSNFSGPTGGHLLSNSARVTTECPRAGDGQLVSQLARFAVPRLFIGPEPLGKHFLILDYFWDCWLIV